MEVVYKKEKSVLEQIDEAIINASVYNKKIEKIVLNKDEFDSVCYQLFLIGEYEREYNGVRIELDEKHRDTAYTTQEPIPHIKGGYLLDKYGIDGDGLFISCKSKELLKEKDGCSKSEEVCNTKSDNEDKWYYDFLGLFRTKDGIIWELAP